MGAAARSSLDMFWFLSGKYLGIGLLAYLTPQEATRLPVSTGTDPRLHQNSVFLVLLVLVIPVGTGWYLTAFP